MLVISLPIRHWMIPLKNINIFSMSVRKGWQNRQKCTFYNKKHFEWLVGRMLWCKITARNENITMPNHDNVPVYVLRCTYMYYNDVASVSLIASTTFTWSYLRTRNTDRNKKQAFINWEVGEPPWNDQIQMPLRGLKTVNERLTSLLCHPSLTRQPV